MKGPSMSSFSQAEIDLGTRLFKYLATNGEYVTPDQMGVFLRQSNLGNQRLSPLWQKTIGASRKNFQLADTLYLLRMLAMVQQGEDLNDEILSSSSFEYLADLSFFPFDSCFDVDSLEDSQPSTPTGSLYLRNQGIGESPLRDASNLQNVQQAADLSISRCISLHNEANIDSAPVESVASVMHVGGDDLANNDLLEHPIVPLNLVLTDSTMHTGSSHISDRHSDIKELADTHFQQEIAYDNSKQQLVHTSSPIQIATSSTAPNSNSTILSSFIDIAKHFQGALLQTQDMVNKVIDASNPLNGLIVVPPEQIVTLKKRLSEMSKKLVDQLNTLSDQTFTNSLSSCLNGLESLSNALTMLIAKEKQLIKLANEIASYLDGPEDENIIQITDSQTNYIKGISVENSETEEKYVQDCSEVDNISQDRLKSSRGAFSSQSENILTTAAAILPATTDATSTAICQEGEKLPPAHPTTNFTPLKKKNLLKLVQDTREVLSRAREVEASYARSQEANAIYKTFSESLSTILQTESETNSNLEEQQKKLEKKADAKMQLVTKQLEQLKSIFSEQTTMFTSIVSAKLSSHTFMDQLNLFTIELADKAVSEVSKVISEMPKLESFSTELKGAVQAKVMKDVKEQVQGHNFPLEIPETSGSSGGQSRGPQSSYSTFSHKCANTHPLIVAQQTIRSIVRDEVRSLKGELIKEIRAIVAEIVAEGRGVRDHQSNGSDTVHPDTALAAVEVGRPQQGGNNASNPLSISTDDQMKQWSYRVGSNIPSSN